MKKLIQLTLYCLIFTVTCFLLQNSVQNVRAATPTPSPKISPTTESTPMPSTLLEKLKQIEILKEKIATKVAEIRQKERGAILGTVKSLDTSTIAITGKGEPQSISFSEDTIFYTLTPTGRTDSTVTKLKAGDSVSIFGYFDEVKKILAAKYIYQEPTPLVRLGGKITDIDKSNYTVTVKGTQETTIVDIETTTKISTYAITVGWAKGGFSKLKLGDRIHVLGTPNSKEPNRISADKMYIIPAVLQTSPTPQESEKSSSPSGLKSSPTPTSKAK